MRDKKEQQGISKEFSEKGELAAPMASMGGDFFYSLLLVDCKRLFILHTVLLFPIYINQSIFSSYILLCISLGFCGWGSVSAGFTSGGRGL